MSTRIHLSHTWTALQCRHSRLGNGNDSFGGRCRYLCGRRIVSEQRQKCFSFGKITPPELKLNASIRMIPKERGIVNDRDILIKATKFQIEMLSLFEISWTLIAHTLQGRRAAAPLLDRS
jgi:hypothetical protein